MERTLLVHLQVKLTSEEAARLDAGADPEAVAETALGVDALESGHTEVIMAEEI